MKTGVSEEDHRFSSRLEMLHRAYELRLESVKESISRAVTSVLEDDLLATMREESTSRGFIVERVKEIFIETINNDKDALLDSLSKEMADFKAEVTKLQEDKSRVGYYIISII